MTIDIAALVVTAQRLINENGRSVTFIEHDKTLEDAAKPWDGPADPRATPNSTSVLDAVFVSPSEGIKLGLANEQSDLIKDADQIMIVSPGSIDLAIFQEVLDETIYWKITNIETLRPGTTTALAYVGIKR